MSRDEHETARQAGHLCPACRTPVTEHIERHKTMGVYVPLWKTDSCHNPECPSYEPAEGEHRHRRHTVDG
ncbi:hypothetical protein [Streptomyces sp. NPDC015131]|uniref:hypothetical protein n=1 Tax=Streptomyces sp. NPDC015131 TaxID=3364941 RepID=UPI0036FE8919